MCLLRGSIVTILKANQFILILLGIAVFLAVVTVCTTFVTSLDQADWGLLSRLPVAYWLGIVSLGLAIVFSLRNSISLNTRTSFALVILIMVYINVLPIFVEQPVGLSPNALWPLSEANNVIATGHISIGKSGQLMSYDSWPFFTLFASLLKMVTGTPLIVLTKWFPILTVSLWGLLVFLVLKKFTRPEFALLGVGLFICGSWTKQQYFGPQSFAFSLFLLFLYLILNRSRYELESDQRPFFALTFITFVATVFSHALTSLVLLLIILVSYAAAKVFAAHEVRKKKSDLFFFLLCCVVFFSYTINLTPRFFNFAFNTFVNYITGQTGFAVAQRLIRLPGSQIQQLTNGSIYLLIIAYLSISLIGLLQIIRKKTMPLMQVTFLIGSFAAIFLVSILPYTSEAPFRAFIFGLPLFSLLAVYLLKKKPKVLGSFLLLALIVGIPALYGSESYRLATASELQGANYTATYLPNTGVLFYKVSPYIRYYEPSAILHFVSLGRAPFLSYNTTTTEANLNASDYIVVSRSQTNYYVYYLGINPLEDIDLNGQPDLAHARLYDNGNFTVYDSSPS